MQHALILASSVLALLSYIIYEWSIFYGTTRPHRITRFVIMVITILGATSLFASSDRVAVWLVGTYAVNSVVLFFITLKYGMGGWAKSDILCLLIALAGIITWRISHDPALGLFAAVLADAAGMIPTLIKTHHHPETEYGLFFLIDVAAAALTLLAVSEWKPEVIAYPLYLVIINIVMVVLSSRKRVPMHAQS